MSKRFTAALTALGCALAVGACGDDNQTADATGAERSSDPPKVRTIHPGKVNQGTWDPAQHAAYKRAADQGGWDLQVAEAVPYGEAAEQFDRWGREGVDVVFSIDAGYEEALLRAAQKYPETAWVMMTALSSTQGLENVASYSIDWCELGYAQGVLGALASRTGVVANVGAVKILPAELIVEGEKAGIEATGKDVELRTEYSGDFLAADKASELVSAVINNGADVVIGLTNGGVAAQLAARVQREGGQYIGTYLDESKFAPDATVASATSDFSRDYAAVVKSQQAGTFRTAQVVRGFSDGVLALKPGSDKDKALTDQAQALVQQMKLPSTGKCAKG